MHEPSEEQRQSITAELAPPHEVPDYHKVVNYEENDGTENKQEQSQQSQPDIKLKRHSIP